MAPGPLRRVLLAMSNPSHLRPPLDLDGERTRIEKALEGLSIRPKVLRHATLAKLREVVADDEPQIVHFMGHGIFDADLGEGVLLLEDEDRMRGELTASTLAGFFAGKPMPRLVVLASCLSADSGTDPAFGPFASVAAALVAAGLPAVIAMQTTVRNRSVIRFTERLYQRIAAGDPIEAAVSRARIALRAGHADTLDWAVPVLFVRGPAEGPRSQREPALPAPQLSPERRSVSPSQIVNNYGDVRNQVNSTHVEKQSNNFS